MIMIKKKTLLPREQKPNLSRSVFTIWSLFFIHFVWVFSFFFQVVVGVEGEKKGGLGRGRVGAMHLY